MSWHQVCTAQPSGKPFIRIPTLLLGMLYSPRCRSCSPPRSRSGTAHPSSNWFQEVREAAASRAWRGHPTDSHMFCQEMISMSVVLHYFLLFSPLFSHFPRKRSFFLQMGNMMFPPKQARHDRIHFDWIEFDFGIPEVPFTSIFSKLFSFCNSLNQPVDVLPHVPARYIKKQP